MDAFHTEKGRSMYPRLPKSKAKDIELLEKELAPDSSTQLNFRKLRNQLEADGWWNRDYIHEAKLLSIWVSLLLGAGMTAHTLPGLSIIFAALAMTNAGWLGHDYIHGVDKFSEYMRNFAAFGAGLSPTWWSDKHNKHHALSTCDTVFHSYCTVSLC